MFHKSIAPIQAAEPMEPLQPDSSRRAGWLRRLKREWDESPLGVRFAQDQPQAVQAELFVPDGRLALLLQDGRPVGWFQPGRHPLPAARIKLEARLFASDPPRDLSLEAILSLPYERALLYVDGVHVGIVKPGECPSPESPRPVPPPGFRLAKVRPSGVRPSGVRPSGGVVEDDDRFQDFSFV